MRLIIIGKVLEGVPAVQELVSKRGTSISLITLSKDIIPHLQAYTYDAAILHYKIDNNSCASHIKKIRKVSVTPLFIVHHTGLISPDERISLLNSGADYIYDASISKEEFIAYLNAITRRIFGKPQECLKVGSLEIDWTTHLIKVQGKPVYFTEKEQLILELFLKHAGEIVSKDQLLDYVYGGNNEPESRIIDTFIARIRRKLSKLRKGSVKLETVWGRGYRLSL